MPEKSKSYELLVRVILPPILGALGAIAATAYPVFHAAFCAGALRGLP